MATNQDSSSSNRAQDQAHSAETSIKSTKTSFLDQVSLFVMPLLGVIILVVDAIFNERIDSIWTPEFLFHHALILLVGLVFSFSQTKKWKNVFPKRRKDWGSTWEILDPGWRTFWVALWVVAVISVPFRIYDIEWWLEIFILASILAFLAVQYRNFWSALFQFAAGFPVLFLLVLLAYGLVFGQLGTSQGIQHLFWSGNDLWSLVWASFGMTWLLAFIGNIAFLVDPDPLRTAHKIGVFRHYLADPSEVPFVYRLQGFLRTVRFPFLVVLGLPAVFPFLFYGVPKSIPTGFGIEDALSTEGYLIRIAQWFAGMLIGVITYEALVSLSSYLTGVIEPRSQDFNSFAKQKQGELLDEMRKQYWRTANTAFWILVCLITPFALYFSELADVFWAIVIGITILVLALCRETIFDQGSSQSAGITPERIQIKNCEAMENCAKGLCPASSPQEESLHENCLEARKRTTAIRSLMLFFLLIYAMCSQFEFIYKLIPPSFSIGLLLAVVAVITSALTYFWPKKRILYTLLFLVYISLVNNQVFKDRFPGMAIYYERKGAVNLRCAVDRAYFPERANQVPCEPKPDSKTEAEYSLVSNEDSLKAWKSSAAESYRKRKESDEKCANSTKEEAKKPTDDEKTKPKLVVISVSGGASRSAYWTAVVIDQLRDRLQTKENPELDDSVRIITGASGGMVGAACYVEALYRKHEKIGEDKDFSLAEILDGKKMLDGLTETTRYIALRNVPRSLLPRFIYPSSNATMNYREFDRGTILEKQWSFFGDDKNSREPDRTFNDYKCLELCGKIPSLILSPMTVEDGRFLFITNLDLSAKAPLDEKRSEEHKTRKMVFTEGGKVTDRLDGETVDPYSLLGIEFFKIFPKATEFRIATAVRMSASFPFFSPAVYLPTDTPRRVVDAGYYDAKGIHVATAWIAMNREWLCDNTSGVLLVQIRDEISALDRWYINDQTQGVWDRIATGFGFLLSPLQGASQARSSTSMFRNDRDVADLSNWFTKAMGGKREFFTTVVFENPAGVATTTSAFKNSNGLPGGDVIPKPQSEDGQKNDEGETNVWRKKINVPSPISMTWNLTTPEMESMNEAFPKCSDHKDWEDNSNAECKRQCQVQQLESVVNETKDEKRSYALMALIKIRNYERLLRLKNHWWKTDHSKP